MKKYEFILQKALAMNPSERARIAHCLISSLEAPINDMDEDIETEWLRIAEQRLNDYENGKTETMTWDEIRRSIYKNAAS